jgi:parvulin-like peptidyl-prolyl isomerase
VYKFIQTYGKQLMAVFSAFLMIAFMLPAAAKYSGAGKNPVVGKLNGQKIRAVDTYNAEQAWKLLNDIRINQQGSTLASILGPDAVQQINRRPVLFLLLQKEAQDMGASVSEDQLNSLMTNVPQLAQFNNTQRADAVKSALFQLMLVRAGFQRATSAIKVSDPMVEHQLAELGQTMSLSAVDFTTAQYLPKVAEPTADQLKAQFEKFADNLKGDTSTSNPFGFGYKYPNRIKLQYIAVPRADVRKFVENVTAPGKAKDP